MYLKATICSFGVLVAACAGAQTPAPALNVPEKLKPSNEALAFVSPAKGAQIYECRARSDQPASYAWAFVAPDAELFDETGNRIGKHYAGPHWESPDGSKVVGAVKESAASPRADSIPWLLLTAKSVGSQGSFSDVTSIQRVNTTGGVAPVSGCSQDAVGTTVRVPYTADYYFLKRN